VLISGNNKVFPKNGIYTFTNLTFTASPMYHSTIIISSGALDLAKRKLLEKSKEIESSYILKEIAFRQCQEGETNQNNLCVKCPKGTYSFDPLVA
jgi:hypothetical protein